MRVLQLGPYPPPHGGVQTHVVALRQFLLSRNVPCAVINLTRFRKPEVDAVYYPRTALEVLSLLLRLRYDLIHLHVGGNFSLRLLGLGLVCSLIPRTCVVLTLHSGGYPSSPAARNGRPFSFQGFVLRRFDGLIGVNPEIMNWFHQCGVLPTRTRLISPYAFTADPSCVGLPDRMATFFRQHRPLLLSVGLLEPEYDLSLQIHVLGQIREKFARAGLVIIGSGSLQEELPQRIQLEPYADHILLCGDVPHPIAMRAMAESDLFLRTTLYDGDSIAVREALQLGLPVIATDNGMRPEGVVLIPPSNANALRSAILDQLSRPVERRVRLQAKQDNLEAVLEFYKQLLA